MQFSRYLGSGWHKKRRGVGILLHKRWKKCIISFVAVNERICYVDLDAHKWKLRLIAVYMPDHNYSNKHVTARAKRTKRTATATSATKATSATRTTLGDRHTRTHRRDRNSKKNRGWGGYISAEVFTLFSIFSPKASKAGPVRSPFSLFAHTSDV